MKEVEEDGYTYLGTVELDKIKESEMKEKTIKEYKRRLRNPNSIEETRSQRLKPRQWLYFDTELE